MRTSERIALVAELARARNEAADLRDEVDRLRAELRAMKRADRKRAALHRAITKAQNADKEDGT